MKALAVGLFAALMTTAAFAGDNVTYKVGGADYEGYFAKADGTSKGLILIVHDWDGLDAYEQKRADMLAKMGYDAFAIDLYGKGNRPETLEKRKTETAKLYKDRATMRTRLLGGLAAAQKQSSGDTVVIGYCFGGAAALELARSGKASRVVGYTTFHGGLATPQGQLSQGHAADADRPRRRRHLGQDVGRRGALRAIGEGRRQIRDRGLFRRAARLHGDRF